MEVILKQNILGVGEEGDIIRVKRGFARNYLLPKNLCVLKTPHNLRILEKHRAFIEERKQAILKQSLDLKEKIANLSIIIERKVVEGNKLYGSVTSRDIVELLTQEGLEISKHNIEMSGHLKIIGNYLIPIRLSSGNKANLKITIKALED